MHDLKSKACLSAALCLIIAPLAWGDTMRCGNKLVEKGDSIVTVNTLCGAPTSVVDRFDVISAPGEGETADELQPPKGETHSDDSETSDSLQPDAISSLCGLPAVTVPCGFDKNRMPVGIQFMARALDDQAALSAANLLQAHTDWHSRHPALA